MLPTERRIRIKELVSEKKNVKISELSKVLGVSEMTVHRDIKPLVEEGFIVKTFGGISLVQNELPNKSNMCSLCSRAINEKLAYRIILSNNSIEVACCAHCGLLRHRQLLNENVQAICHDFLKHTTINATQAWFVMDSSLDISCCQPQVITFEQKNNAKKFVKGFGGTVYSFYEAIETVYNRMNGDKCNAHHINGGE